MMRVIVRVFLEGFRVFLLEVAFALSLSEV